MGANKIEWQNIKDLLGLGKEKKDIPTLIDNEGKKSLTTDEKLTAFSNNLKTVFCKELPSLDEKHFNEVNGFINGNSHLFYPSLSSSHLFNNREPVLNIITMEEIKEVIDSLDPKKAPGLDKITNKIIKLIFPAISSLLLWLFNTSLLYGIFPNDWKTATISMLPKPKKDKKNPANYRPLSLTSCLGKCLEKIVTKRIYTWAESNNKINKQQNGFRKGRSTNDSLFKLTQTIKNGFITGNVTTGIFLDVEKAFDQVWHKGLLYKLNNIGLPNILLRWIGDFLGNRKMIVHLNNKSGEPLKPIHGVPQGSPLSPILFLPYVADIPETSDGIIISQFADDISVFSCSKFYKLNEIRLQRYLSALFIWCTKWRIKLNPTKTKIVHFHKTKKILNTKLKLGNESLKVYPYVTFLGITLDHGLSFSKHVEEKIEEVQYIKSMLYKLKGKYFGPSEKNMISLYKVFIRSKFEYGCCTLVLAKPSRIYNFEKEQSKFLRFTLSLNKKKTTTLNKFGNIQSIHDRIRELSKRWIEKSLHNNNDVREFVSDCPVISPEMLFPHLL